MEKTISQFNDLLKTVDDLSLLRQMVETIKVKINNVSTTSFRVGDTVKLISKYDNRMPFGGTGTIIKVNQKTFIIDFGKHGSNWKVGKSIVEKG